MRGRAGDLDGLTGALRCAGCAASGTRLCPACGTLRPGGRDGMVWAWRYEGAPRALVLAAKLRADSAAAEALGEGLWRAWAATASPADAITWVPGRKGDIRRRGFDHAHAIALQVADRSGLPLLPLLVRRISNADQAGLDAAARRGNLEGVLTATPSPPRCLLIDDVVTSGATAAAGVRALEQAGASHVQVAAACGPRSDEPPQEGGVPPMHTIGTL